MHTSQLFPVTDRPATHNPWALDRITLIRLPWHSTPPTWGLSYTPPPSPCRPPETVGLTPSHTFKKSGITECYKKRLCVTRCRVKHRRGTHALSFSNRVLVTAAGPVCALFVLNEKAVTVDRGRLAHFWVQILQSAICGFQLELRVSHPVTLVGFKCELAQCHVTVKAFQGKLAAVFFFWTVTLFRDSGPGICHGWIGTSFRGAVWYGAESPLPSGLKSPQGLTPQNMPKHRKPSVFLASGCMWTDSSFCSMWVHLITSQLSSQRQCFFLSPEECVLVKRWCYFLIRRYILSLCSVWSGCLYVRNLVWISVYGYLAFIMHLFYFS